MRHLIYLLIACLLAHDFALALRETSHSRESHPGYLGTQKKTNTNEEKKHKRGLLSFLKKISIDETVLMTFASNVSTTDHPQFGVLKTWVSSVKKARISNAFVAAYDEATMVWAKQHDMPSFLMPFPKEQGNAHSWVAVAKTDAIRDVLSLGYNVLFSDADVLFFGNPFTHLDGSFDCETQSEGFGGDNVAWHGSSRSIPDTLIHMHVLPQLNFGLAYVRGTPSMAQSFHHLGQMIREQPTWDQELYSQMMLFPATSEFPWRGRHSVRLFEPTLFPTTCQVKNLFSNESLREMHPVAIHFNCNHPPTRRKTIQDAWSKHEKGEDFWDPILSS